MCNLKVGDRVVVNSNSTNYAGTHGIITDARVGCCPSSVGICGAVFAVKLDGQKYHELLFSYKLDRDSSAQQAPTAPATPIKKEGEFYVGCMVNLKDSSKLKITSDWKFPIKVEDIKSYGGEIYLTFKHPVDKKNRDVHSRNFILVSEEAPQSTSSCTCQSLLLGCVCGAGRAEMAARKLAIDPMVDFFKSSTKEWKAKHVT